VGKAKVPTMKLLSWDGTAVFNLMGGENIPTTTTPGERVRQRPERSCAAVETDRPERCATQDGRSFITSLYDPAEVEATLVVKGKTPAQVRKTRQRPDRIHRRYPDQRTVLVHPPVGALVGTDPVDGRSRWTPRAGRAHCGKSISLPLARL
jgi:hypothetical protein